MPEAEPGSDLDQAREILFGAHWRAQEQRIAALEQAVGRLTGEVETLRRELAQLGHASASGPSE